MITINIDPVLVQLGPLAVRWYGLMYAVGIMAGLYIAFPYALKKGLREDDLWAVFWPAVLAGLVGARLYYVIQQPLGAYIEQPWRIVATWEGGMAFYGAVFAVVAVLLVYCWRKGIPFWPLADAAALFAVIGQGFGRIGNFINGDVIGYMTDLPWGVVYTHPGSFVPDHTVAYQPAAAYELLFNIALFALLWRLRNRLPKPGLLFVVYLITYSVGQFFLFFVRANEIVALGLRQAQLTSLVVLVVALVLGWWLMRQPQSMASGHPPVASGQ